LKERLDAIVLRKGWASSREEAARLIGEGRVRVNALVRTDPTIRAEYDRVEYEPVEKEARFAGRGALKLEGALDFFSLSPAGQRIVDLGAATGGFTDCLLRRGALSVRAVDVGHGLIDARLRADPRVVVVESANVRFPGAWMPADPVDGVVADLSFISLSQVLAQVATLLRGGGWFLGLVKPQFEASPDQVEKGGVVRDPGVRKGLLRRFVADLAREGATPGGLCPSGIRGRKKGNQEYFCLAWWKGLS
jgi:23S rRNA (cytidine1920-2'-O)/16S rRNA (cytidine1409-2'-O)-methyltransferase